MVDIFDLVGKDVGSITGTGDRNGQKILCKARRYFGMESHARISVIDYSIYSGMQSCQIFHRLKISLSEKEMDELQKLKEQSQKEWERKKREKGE